MTLTFVVCGCSDGNNYDCCMYCVICREVEQEWCYIGETAEGGKYNSEICRQADVKLFR